MILKERMFHFRIYLNYFFYIDKFESIDFGL